MASATKADIILGRLEQSRGQAVSRDDLAKLVDIKSAHYHESRYLDMTVARARKMARAKGKDIKAVYGKGYKLVRAGGGLGAQ